jgi:hypothetical protein
MLASLLPGIRGIRSALVAGYMWFGAVWLLVAHIWPVSAGGRPVLSEPTVRLIELFGTGGKIIAISVLCLLVGEVTSVTVQSIFFRLAQRCLRQLTPSSMSKPRKGWQRLFWPMSSRSLNRVYTKVLQEHRNREIDTGTEPGASERLALEAVREVLYMSPRLIVAKPELYAEYDRVKAESEFRDAILLPLPILGTAICLNLNMPLWTKAVVMVLIVALDGYLFLQARRLFRTAHSMVAHSVADGTISSATLSVAAPNAARRVSGSTG